MTVDNGRLLWNIAHLIRPGVERVLIPDIGHETTTEKEKERNKHCFLVDTLNDVDLSAVGPSAITKSPKSRPYRATERHGFKISNKETMVQFLRGGDTNAMTEKNGRIRHARPSTTLRE